MSLSEMSIGFDLLLNVNLLSAKPLPEITTLPRFCTHEEQQAHGGEARPDSTRGSRKDT